MRAHLRVERGDSGSSNKGQASQMTLGQMESLSSDIPIQAGCVMAAVVDTLTHMSVTLHVEKWKYFRNTSQVWH